jgi:hypothetical protein
VKVNVKVPCVTLLLGVRVTFDVTAPPCKLSTEGETEHWEFGGPPEQLSATFPVRPPIGVRVIVYAA